MEGARKKLKLQIFNSFEAAVEAEAQNDARQSPEDRLRETVELILRVYGVTRDQLMLRHNTLRINIISGK